MRKTSRRVILNSKHCPDGMDVRVWWFALRQLDCCDAKRPDIRLAVVLVLGEDLWTHPKRAAD